jgi:hypothetical protein
MSKIGESIPVKVEVNEDDRTAIILIPWQQLGTVTLDEFRAWLEKVAKLRAEWEAKGYRCN